MYKKVPFLLCHLSLILPEMWPSFDLPQSRFGVTGLIHKDGSGEEVSNYRPVTITNTDGKILLSILASRSLSYMKSNGYYDLGIQKGFINDMAGCAEHTTMLSEVLKKCQANQQANHCMLDRLRECFWFFKARLDTICPGLVPLPCGIQTIRTCLLWGNIHQDQDQQVDYRAGTTYYWNFPRVSVIGSVV